MLYKLDVGHYVLACLVSGKIERHKRVNIANLHLHIFAYTVSAIAVSWATMKSEAHTITRKYGLLCQNVIETNILDF